MNKNDILFKIYDITIKSGATGIIKFAKMFGSILDGNDTIKYDVKIHSFSDDENAGYLLYDIIKLITNNFSDNIIFNVELNDYNVCILHLNNVYLCIMYKKKYKNNKTLLEYFYATTNENEILTIIFGIVKKFNKSIFEFIDLQNICKTIEKMVDLNKI